MFVCIMHTFGEMDFSYVLYLEQGPIFTFDEGLDCWGRWEHLITNFNHRCIPYFKYTKQVRHILKLDKGTYDIC